jgi:hypothetical protein
MLVIELEKERVPFALPLTVGVNETLNTAFCPAGSVRGNAGPLTKKPDPTSAAWKIVALDCPELLTTIDWVAVLPNWTLPKLTLEGLSANCPLAQAVRRRMLNRIDLLTGKGKLTSLKASPLAPRYGSAGGGILATTPVNSERQARLATQAMEGCSTLIVPRAGKDP